MYTQQMFEKFDKNDLPLFSVQLAYGSPKNHFYKMRNFEFLR